MKCGVERVEEEENAGDYVLGGVEVKVKSTEVFLTSSDQAHCLEPAVPLDGSPDT